ncbi:MAG: M1 family aminopeptidase [Betaproteobacteria bacterium]|nr:M1 family aminopeptidase [Betaproteobacteria bacterium]
MNFARLLAPLGLSLAAAAVSAHGAHLDLEVDLVPATRSLQAVAAWRSDGEARFLLHRALDLHDVELDGRSQSFGPPVDQGEYRLWRILAHKGARLRIRYGGVLPALDLSLDHRSVLGHRAPMASREGSFLPGAGAWYPRPAERFTWRVQLRLPGDQRGLVAGRLIAESLPRSSSGRTSATFAAEHPTESIDLVVGPYAVRERLVARAGQPPLRLRTYFYRDMDALAKDYLEDCKRYIELYAEQIGAYPYTEYSVVASPLPTGYGMPRFAYIGAAVLKLPFIRASSLRHEVLHNWWGNGVHTDAASGNWSEGLTTFMADYAAKEQESPLAATAMRLAWLRDFAAIAPGAHQSLASFRSRSHGAQAAIGYGKSAMVFLMLRDALGAEVFARGLRRFWEAQRFHVASWDDLRVAFEQVSGQDLASFFAQWLERAGGPTVQIVGARAESSPSGEKLVLSVEQTAPAYALRVPVALVSGSESTTRWIDLRHQREQVALEVAQMPETVQIDPQFRVWRAIDSGELPPILRQWIIARAPRVAVATGDAAAHHAARSLAAKFFEANVEPVAIDAPGDGSEPLLLIGLHADIDTALSRLGLAPRPANLAGQGSAQVWTLRRGARDAPIAVVSARDAASLHALERPLPHYGAQSFLVFDGARLLERGVWPVTGRPVAVTR